jgi:cellulose synthase/poly-beta-1,6-N-acetylglucosamine synthase-like glycosyltransferase
MSHVLKRHEDKQTDAGRLFRGTFHKGKTGLLMRQACGTDRARMGPKSSVLGGKYLGLVLDALPLAFVVVLILNVRSVLAGVSYCMSLLGFTPVQAALILILPLVYDVPKTVAKAAILLSEDMHSRLVDGDGTSPPLGVSVIVPAHNEEKNIERCIEAILEAPYTPKQVIVVDDGSTDATFEKAREFHGRGQVLVVKKEASGTRAGPCNFGTRFATQPVYVFIDADTLMYRDALREIAKPFRDPSVVAVSGNVRVYNTPNLLTKMQAYEYMFSMEIGRRFQSIVHSLLIVPGGFGAVRADLFKTVGEYDISLAEDFDSTLKMHKTGGKIVFADGAIALTVVPGTWRSWVKQRIRWASGQEETLRKHRNILFKQSFGIPGLFGAPEMILADFILLFARCIWTIALLITSWKYLLQVTVLAYALYLGLELLSAYVASLVTPLKRDIRFVAVMPLAVFLYRPLHDMIRLFSYVRAALGTKPPKW